MVFDYQKICSEFLKDLPKKQKEVILRRFGLDGKERETLESIGESFGITRERVRQIQNAGFLKMKPKIEKYQKVFQYLFDQIKANGGFKKEDALLSQLGGQNYKNNIFFLLTLGEPFQRFSETPDFHTLWTINPEYPVIIKKTINFLYNKLKEKGKPQGMGEISSFAKQKEPFLVSTLEVSKTIYRNEDGFFGLKDWPEINPRGVKDKAYLVFKKEKKPLHFREVTKLIGPTTLPQTVHNELIKDQRFVLVGRGIYALREWGYEEGQVKDVIAKILRETRKPLTKKEILDKVLKQRLVKESTILLNLSNKNYFLRDSQGKYQVKEV
jgi:hypothetical protein